MVASCELKCQFSNFIELKLIFCCFFCTSRKHRITLIIEDNESSKRYSVLKMVAFAYITIFGCFLMPNYFSPARLEAIEEVKCTHNIQTWVDFSLLAFILLTMDIDVSSMENDGTCFFQKKIQNRVSVAQKKFTWKNLSGSMDCTKNPQFKSSFFQSSIRVELILVLISPGNLVQAKCKNNFLKV